MKKILLGFMLSLLAVPGWSQTYFTIFGPAAGIQKNTGATPFNTAAVAADVYGLWSGTCSTTTFLRGDGSCAIPAGTGVSSVTVASPLAASGGCSGGACSITWTATLGDIHYGSGVNTIGILAGNTTSTKQFLTQTGTGTVSAAPAWGAITAGDLPSLGANPTGTIGLTAVNGTATTYIRSDGAPALSQAISPTWTSNHTFSGGSQPITINSPTITNTGLLINGLTGGLAGVELSANNGSSLGFLGVAGATNQLQTGSSASDFIIRSNSGGIRLGNASGAFLSANSAGNVTISVPSSGATLTINNIGAGSPAASISAPSSGIRPAVYDVGTGQIGLAMNSTGSDNGLIQNDSANKWSLSHNSAINALGIDVLSWNATGNVTISAPSSGNALTVNGLANAYSVKVVGSSTSGVSDGLLIAAGTNSSDNALTIDNQTLSAQFFTVFGDGGQTNGSPTGADKGAGTINTAGNIFINNVSIRITSVSIANTCTTNGACTLLSNNGFASVTRTAAGSYVANLTTAYNSAPVCVVGSILGSNVQNQTTLTTTGTTGATVGTFANTGAGTATNPTDAGFSLICQGN